MTLLILCHFSEHILQRTSFDKTSHWLVIFTGVEVPFKFAAPGNAKALQISTNKSSRRRAWRLSGVSVGATTFFLVFSAIILNKRKFALLNGFLLHRCRILHWIIDDGEIDIDMRSQETMIHHSSNWKENNRTLPKLGSIVCAVRLILAQLSPTHKDFHKCFGPLKDEKKSSKHPISSIHHLTT